MGLQWGCREGSTGPQWGCGEGGAGPQWGCGRGPRVRSGAVLWEGSSSNLSEHVPPPPLLVVRPLPPHPFLQPGAHPAFPPGARMTWWPWMAGCTPWGVTTVAPASTPSRSTTRGPTSGWPHPACSPGAAVWVWRCWSCSISRRHPPRRCPCPPPASDPPTTRDLQPPTCLKGTVAPTRDVLRHPFTSLRPFLHVFI